MPSTIIPTLRYRDAPAAIAWLQKVIGFAPKAVYEGQNGTIDHAELTLGDGMIMLSSLREQREQPPDEMVQPDQVALNVTQAPYVTVPDARKVHVAALAAGATTLADPVQMSYGGWGSAFRDPEGHLWHIGEYDPWAQH